MENSKIDIFKIPLADQENLVVSYIDAAYHYFENNKDIVKDNLCELQKGNSQSVIPYFKYVINNQLLENLDVCLIIKDYLDRFISDYDIYITEAISVYSARRYDLDKNDELLSVHNKYGDLVYYNKNRLDYLREKYGKIKDKSMKSSIKDAIKNADLRRGIFQRLGSSSAPNYSIAQHLEYKYYIMLFIKEHNIELEYKKYKEDNEKYGFKTISLIEFTEEKIDIELTKDKLQRKRS